MSLRSVSKASSKRPESSVQSSLSSSSSRRQRSRMRRRTSTSGRVAPSSTARPRCPTAGSSAPRSCSSLASRTRASVRLPAKTVFSGAAVRQRSSFATAAAGSPAVRSWVASLLSSTHGSPVGAGSGSSWPGAAEVGTGVSGMGSATRGSVRAGSGAFAGALGSRCRETPQRARSTAQRSAAARVARGKGRARCTGAIGTPIGRAYSTTCAVWLARVVGRVPRARAWCGTPRRSAAVSLTTPSPRPRSPALPEVAFEVEVGAPGELGADVVDQLVPALVARAQVLGDHLLDEVVDVRGDPAPLELGRGEALHHLLAQHLAVVGALEREPPDHDVEERDPQAVDVRADVGRGSAARLLGREVGDRAHARVLGSRAGLRSGEAEVDQDDAPVLAEHDVAGLHVAVDDAVLAEVAQDLRGGQRDAQGFRLLEAHLPIEELEHRRALDELEAREELVAAARHAEAAHEARVLQALEHARLGDEAIARRIVARRRGIRYLSRLHHVRTGLADQD